MIYHGISLAHFEKKQEKNISTLALKRCVKKAWYQKRECSAWKVAGTHLSAWISQFHILHFWPLSTNEYMPTTLRTTSLILLQKQFYIFRVHYKSLPPFLRGQGLKRYPDCSSCSWACGYGMTLQVSRFPSQQHGPYRSSVFYFCHRDQQLSSDAMQ